MIRLFTASLLFLSACATKQKKDVAQDDRFTLPPIIQNHISDTIKPRIADALDWVEPPLIGKLKFGDTINISNLKPERKSEQEYLWEVKNIYSSDSLSSDGLQIIPDYATSIVYSEFTLGKNLYFPVYVVNETHEPRVFFGADNYGYAIQEAISDSNPYIWYPVESKPPEMGCELHFRKKINPKEFLVFLLPKYSGTDTTLSRIRFKIGENVFISKSFKGAINPKQFELDKKSWIYRILKESKGDAEGVFFYGGRVKKNTD